ncbi:complex I assembly factor TIMMDC1, mitochondrial isoform X2 [Cynoglossus semilaevis]|nr:complex I assembly factor TIMMDC1, mitochondrial isoform X2 [Cynoglossus semilaevis]
MCPERQTWQPYSGTRAMASTVSLQHLLQNIRPPAFLFSLPKVYAAEAAAAHTTQRLSSPSGTAASAENLSQHCLPKIIGQPEFPDTGWDRLKELFTKDEFKRYPEEISNVIKSGLVAALAGMIYGGLPAGFHARQNYIQKNQAEIYTCNVDAVRSAHNAAIRGFIRYGFRWSWRVAAFVTLFNSISIGLEVYRDKVSLSNYAAAGAVTAGLFRLNLGLRGLVAGTVIGTFLGLPTGALILSLQSLSGESVRERRKRERRELYEQRLAEWTENLQLTDELIGNLDDRTHNEETSKDIRRIQELLTSPENTNERVRAVCLYTERFLYDASKTLYHCGTLLVEEPDSMLE